LPDFFIPKNKVKQKTFTKTSEGLFFYNFS